MEVPDGLSSEVRKAEPAGPPPPGSVSKIAPTTRAASVMVIDAHTGEIFYEKNADAPRPAASTQKLLTALIVAEQAYLDRPVTVQAGDTMAEPVKLIIAKAAYANPTIRSIVCLPNLVFRYANGRTRELENTNKVLKRLSYCNGMKTGYTEAAGHCLIASGARPGRDIIVVVLGDSKSGVWQDASALLSWGLWM